MTQAERRSGWTLGIVSVALFMVVLDNLVVSVAVADGMTLAVAGDAA
jgi:hypothetical protein